jgi:hypothetical protein
LTDHKASRNKPASLGKWREGFSGRRVALCEEEMEVQFGGQCSELIDFYHLYFYHTIFPASKIAGCRGIIPLLGEFEGATPPQGLGF